MPLLLRAMFGPPRIPQRFKREFPISMLLRPCQLRASAEEGAMMNDEVEALQQGYDRMRMNTYIVAGESDRIISPRLHSEVLARVVPHCTIDVIPAVGHMVHHSAIARVGAMLEKACADEPKLRQQFG
jgi:pimeloyl-ACP methyl ester carboxylesterase